MTNLEFLTSAPHVDPALLTPVLCARACESMGYQLSAILSGEFCFCKLNFPIISNKVADTLCYASGNCAADSSYFCGNSNYMLVYWGSTVRSEFLF